MNEQIRIETIKIKDLYEFACQNQNKSNSNDIIPIVKHIARAHCRNPYADQHDISLIVAYIRNTCIGYIGLLPGLLRVGNTFSKVYWFTTFHVPQKFKKTAAGVFLIMKAISLPYDLVVYRMSKEAEHVYRGLKLQEFEPLRYWNINIGNGNILSSILRFGQRALKKLRIHFEFINLFIKVSEHMFYPIKNIFYWVLLRRQSKYLEEIDYKEVNEIQDSDMPQHATYDTESAEFYRSSKIINWMLQEKWILECRNSVSYNINYFFSPIRDMFRYLVLKLYSSQNQSYKGFFILSISSEHFKTTVKVLDVCFANPDDYKYIFPIVIKQARKYQANDIIFPDMIMNYINKSIVERLFLHARKAFYFCRPKNTDSPLATSLHKIQINFCDGDVPFS